MKYKFTILLFYSFTFSCLAQWKEVNHGIEISQFNDVKAITSEIAIVIGSNGTIVKTNDGGETWQLKTSGINYDLKRLEFPTANVGYIIGGNNILLKTNDGGETWKSLTTNHSSGFYDISCVNENLIFISTNNGVIKSEDGGESWIELSPSPFYENIKFINDNMGFVSRSSTWMNYEFENDLAKTIDGGQTWQEIKATSPFGFSNENIGFFYFNGLYKTMNEGNQFDLVSSLSYPALSDIMILNENTIWGIFYWQTLDYANPVRGILKATANGEYTSYMFPHKEHGYNLKKIHFANENTGYIVGSKWDGTKIKGLIWKNTNGLNQSMKTKEENLFQFKIYPNPTNKEINISLQRLMNQTFDITLNDMTGKQVYSKKLLNTPNVKILISEFSKGTYILTIKMGQEKYSQKVIIN